MNQREKYELVNRIIHRPTKYIIVAVLFTLFVFAGFVAGAYALGFVLLPPPETRIVNGYAHRPCGLVVLPAVIFGGGVGMLVGGYLAVRIVLKVRSRQLVSE